MFFKVLSTENMRRKQEQEWLPWIQILIPSISLRKKINKCIESSFH